jgi:hypothetical protein
MAFPADIKDCMKDCILSILWPRQEIFVFFQSNGCTSADLTPIANFKETGMSRATMVDAVFTRISSRTDGGLGQFRAMLQSLIGWSRFDPYFFETIKKLDRSQAEKNLAHLRQLQEIRDAKIQSDRERRAATDARRQHPEASIEELRTEFLSLYGGKTSPQHRGYSLQTILLGLAKLSALEITEPFTINGEQIDGAIKFEGEHYLIEAKWQDQSSSNEPVYQFAGKIDGKMYGRGMFVSVNGFSVYVVQSLVIGKAINTILVDGEDLILALEGHLTFRDMIDTKVKAAQTRGLIYVHPISGKSKS